MFLYVHKYPPARPSEANFALPEPARSPKSQEKAGSSPPEAQKLEARTSLINALTAARQDMLRVTYLGRMIIYNLAKLYLMS